MRVGRRMNVCHRTTNVRNLAEDACRMHLAFQLH